MWVPLLLLLGKDVMLELVLEIEIVLVLELELKLELSQTTLAYRKWLFPLFTLNTEF